MQGYRFLQSISKIFVNLFLATQIFSYSLKTVTMKSPAASISAMRSRFYYASKRLMDVTVSGMLLVMLSPIMLAIAVMVKLDSRGPALFKQQRVGSRLLNPATGEFETMYFTIYKFRTMYTNADERLHKEFVQAFIKSDEGKMRDVQPTGSDARKLERDPRITRIGHILRKTSLDELPQLWNVFKGEMTLVGPRPALKYEVDVYENWHMKRLDALQGMTGWWQVAARSSCDFDEMVELDVWYAENQSLWLDIKILFLTPIVMLTAKGGG